MNLKTAFQNPRNRKRKPNCLSFLFSLLILACLNPLPGARAEVTLPHIFGSNMVLQREKPLFVWGWAAPGEAVGVKFAEQERHTFADDKGYWQVKLQPLKASSEAAQMSINSLILTNILVGEVWLCSGQSNMEKPIGEQRGQKPVKNFAEELKTGDQYPEIRLFKAEKVLASTPAKDVKGAWQVCSSNSLETMRFSAVGYFFARELEPHIKVPIGLVESSWGGTRIEPWISAEGFKIVPAFKGVQNSSTATNKLANSTPMAIYNGMVAPLVPFGIRGALWYQGESNCSDPTNAPSYTEKMEGLIKGWRAVWREGDFPFYYVQIAPYHYYERPSRRVPRQDALPELWEAQSAALKIPHTGMVVITDLVDDLMDIHPTRKVEVGQRLAKFALAKDYGEKEVVCSGPTFKRLTIRDGKAMVYFNNLGGGLVSQDGQPPNWFSIAGADGVFVPAQASISGDTVVVSSPQVSQPKAVRFAWNEAAQPNLFNKAGLPATPFRTGQ
jgi:sialate O-acetylesterase